MIAQLNHAYIKTKPLKAVERLISFALFEGRPLTTRGRWINPLVFSLLNLEKRISHLKKVIKPVFILGTGRSGTTLMGMLLSIHKQVAYLNEPKAIWHLLYPYEDLVGNYTEDASYYRISAAQVTKEMIAEANNIYGFYLAIMGRDRIVDKYPELVFRTDFVKSIFPDARFIVMVRNGWNTAASIETWSKKNGNVSKNNVEDWWGRNDRKWNLLTDEILSSDSVLSSSCREIKAIGSQKDRGALEWYLSMKEALRVSSSDSHVMLVKYEDLTSAPGPTLEKIFDHCELEVDEKVFQYAGKVIRHTSTVRKFDVHHAIRTAFGELMTELEYDA